MPATDERAPVTLRHGDAGTLIVALRGSWRARSPVPSIDDVARALAGGDVRRLGFEAAALTDWDSTLLAFVTRLLAEGARHETPIDRSGLPDGVQRLLALAEAVPEKEGARRSTDRPPLLARIGLASVERSEHLRDAVGFIGETALSLARFVGGRARYRRSDLWVVVEECGARALPIVTLISFLVGLILAFVGAIQLRQFGASIYVADLVGIAMTREMGAIMTGVIMAGRTGAAFAAQLGTMKVTQEIDALTTMGVAPMDFLVLPRILALTAMMPLLCLYADAVGIIGGGVVGVGMLDITLVQYLDQTRHAVSLTNVWIGVGKGAVFGVLVAVAGCLRGMQCGKSASAVGDAATRAVVLGIVSIIVADGVFAVALNVLGW